MSNISDYAYAINALNKGQVVAIPTEAVYGLSVDASNLSAVEQLLKLKQRDPQKGFILVASDLSQLEPYIQPLSADVAAKLNETWPGPVTWIVPAKEDVSPLLRGEHDSIAVRITAHPILQSICHDFEGAIVSTSANLEGEPPATNEQMVRDTFGDAIAAVVPGSLGSSHRPTEIRDALTDAIIRPGE